MYPNGVHMDQQNVAYDPKLAYVQGLINSFCMLLSPQELPRNMTARMYMDEELWMPIRVLAKLPALDHLLLSDVMFPFVTQTLYNCASHYLEVDVIHETVRPKWALHSSVCISNVDIYATADQVFDLLRDIRSSMTHPNNPFEYENVIISKQRADSWSISFQSPSAGLYAAMSMKSKCINGAQVFPIACVHIFPPKVAYWSMEIPVTEVDVVQHGNPVIPIGYAPHYSENPVHFNPPYNTSAMGVQGPMHYEHARPGTVPFFAPTLRERSYSNQSFCTQPSAETGNETVGDSSFPTPHEEFEHESHSSGYFDTSSTKSDVKIEVENISQDGVGSPQLDHQTAKPQSKVVKNPSEASPGTLPKQTENLNDPTPPKETSHHIVANIADTVEPRKVGKIGEPEVMPKAMEAPETKPHSSGHEEPVNTRGNKKVKASKDVQITWDYVSQNGSESWDADSNESFEDGSTISYPKPESLRAPSFAKQSHVELPRRIEQENGLILNNTPAPLLESPMQTIDSSKQNLRGAGDSNGANGARKDRKQLRADNQEQSGDRHNGKGRNKQSPHGRRTHYRKGSGGSSSGERHRDNSSNGSGHRKRNGHNKKPRNKGGQRSNAESQQRISYHTENLDQRQDIPNALHSEAAGNTSMPPDHRAGSRDDDWQTISYQRLGSKRNRRRYSTTEGSSRNRGRQNGTQRDGGLRSHSTHFCG